MMGKDGQMATIVPTFPYSGEKLSFLPRRPIIYSHTSMSLWRKTVAFVYNIDRK